MGEAKGRGGKETLRPAEGDVVATAGGNLMNFMELKPPTKEDKPGKQSKRRIVTARRKVGKGGAKEKDVNGDKQK